MFTGAFIQEIAAFLIFGLLAARCVVKLIRAIKLRAAFKSRQTVKYPAVIIFTYRHPRSGSDTHYAMARYSLAGKEVNAWMVCAWEGFEYHEFNRHLSKGERVEIIVSKTNPRVFAFSEKQSKDAVMTYAVFTALGVALVAGLMVVTILLS